jgi:hypothetical protein
MKTIRTHFQFTFGIMLHEKKKSSKPVWLIIDYNILQEKKTLTRR